jgi:hypothetical protein
VRARYIGSGDPTDDASCVAFGRTFVNGEWVEGDDLHPKLAANPTFETQGFDAPGPDIDALRAELDAKGIAYHHKAGPAKLAALLAAAPPESVEDDD